MAQRTRELLEAIMTGHQVTVDELDDLLRDRISEDLFLDYKHGNELLDKKKASSTVRQYLSAFANSAGGILIIGVDETKWDITNCVAPGGGDLAMWAASCLTSIAPYFSPPPRFQVVTHPKGNVLIAATERSLGLIPCIEAGEFVYYLRFHDQTLSNKTLRAPEYLIGDLVLGRRQQPYLAITDVNFEAIRVDGGRHDHLDVRFSLNFVLENQNISWAEDVRFGCISWVRQTDPSIEIMNTHLLSHLDVREVSMPTRDIQWKLVHTRKNIGRVEAFEAEDLSQITPYRVNMRNYDAWYHYVWRAGVYILSKSTPPIWYQLSLIVNGEFLQFAHGHAELPKDKPLLTMERLSGTRPIVGCELLPRS